MTAAAPLPQPEVPATAKDLGHKIRVPKAYTTDGVTEWRALCHCHWFDLLDPTEAEEAWKKTASW